MYSRMSTCMHAYVYTRTCAFASIYMQQYEHTYIYQTAGTLRVAIDLQPPIAPKSRIDILIPYPPRNYLKRRVLIFSWLLSIGRSNHIKHNGVCQSCIYICCSKHMHCCISYPLLLSPSLHSLCVCICIYVYAHASI